MKKILVLVCVGLIMSASALHANKCVNDSSINCTSPHYKECLANKSGSITTVVPKKTDSTIKETTWIGHVVNWYDRNMNYATITALMTIESSFIPFPSEVVVPPAAAISTREGSKLNIVLIVLFATLGAIIGALINYYLAVWLGRPLVHKLADSKFGKACLLSSDKIQQAEDYFNKHGKVSTFVGRLIPGIRQLISIPAGLSRMSLLPFIGYTALGAGIWNTILAAIGYVAGDNMDLIEQYAHEMAYLILAVIVIFVIFFVIKYYIKKNKAK